MSDQELELQDPDQWDWETAQLSKPAKGRRTIVSVAFTNTDFRRVAEHAARQGVSVSGFIRGAALERVSRESALIGFDWSSSNQAKAVVHRLEPVTSGSIGDAIDVVMDPQPVTTG